MKKTISIAMAMLLVLLCSACGTSQTPTVAVQTKQITAEVTTEATTTAPRETAEPITVPPTELGEGFISGHYVKIVSAKLAKDYKKNPCVIVTFDWLNHGDEAEAFMFEFSLTVYQNGVQLDSAIVMSDNYDGSAATNKIKPGIEQTVQYAYSLSDDYSPVEVNVEHFGYSSFDDEIITRTFDLK